MNNIITIVCSILLIFSIIIILYLTRRTFLQNECFEKTGQKIFYERDRAGYNNVRLQFETLVAIAGITKRILVIPAPLKISHTKNKYYDLDIYDSKNLSNHIEWVREEDISPMNKDLVYKLDKQIAKVDLRSLPRDKDWFFNSHNSRIQHFECLSLTGKDLKKAENFIINGLKFNDRIMNLFNKAMMSLPKSYNSVHARYLHDYDKDNGALPEDKKGLSIDNVSKKIKEHMKPSEPIYVSTNGSKKFIAELKSKVPNKIFSHFDNNIDMNEFDAIILDMMIASRGNLFMGHPYSTFSTGIIQLRRKQNILEGKSGNKYISITDKLPFQTGGKQGEVCWMRVTNFKNYSYESFELLAI
jgi:hypothetical protein